MAEQKMNRTFPPGYPRAWPLGSMLAFRRDPLRFMLDARDTYGPVVRFWLTQHPIYQLNDPQDIQDVLVTHAKQIEKTSFSRKVMGEFLGNGILTSDGDLHRRRRRLVQPAFHHQRIAGYADGIVAQTAHMLDAWEPGASYDIDDEMMRLTMKIVSRALFGADVGAAADQVGKAIATLQRITVEEFKLGFQVPSWLPVSHNTKRRAAAQVIDNTVQHFIRHRRESDELTDDLLAMLLHAQDEDDGRGMSDREVRDEAVTLFSAGHETTSNALTWTWYLLAHHPHVEQTLHDELARVLGGRLPTLADLANLPYTEQVIKESMRLYPPAWILMSRTPLAPLTIGGYTLVPGDWIFIAPYVVHRDPRFFPAPDRFDPARFTPEQEAARPRFAYFPFGGGPHVCIGNSFAMMEARLILATIAQRYTLTLEPGQTVVPEPEITLRPRNGLRVRLTAREPVPPTPVTA